jgi:6-pyruvoyltetrahydropterin/6-carboxytetrahydropterin synthase
MKALVSRRYRFSASHRLDSPHLSYWENKELYGKCNHPFGHGHDYVLDVQFTGEVDPTTGLIVPLPIVDSFIERHVLADFDHRDLNREVREFEELVPTTENLAIVIADRLLAHWTAEIPYASASLTSISIQETERNSFEVLIPQHIHDEAEVNEVKEGLIIHA